jgi:regulator of protease activity HflC (stomatin/prohibitin superfamily)
VIASGFGDVMPVSEAVYRYRLESWRAPWQRETEVVHASKELEATRIRARSRAAAQRDLASSLGRIFEQYENSQDILVLRLFQALESVVADPRTQRLLPGNAIDMMRTIQGWVMPAPPQTPPSIGSGQNKPRGEME